MDHINDVDHRILLTMSIMIKITQKQKGIKHIHSDKKVKAQKSFTYDINII